MIAFVEMVCCVDKLTWFFCADTHPFFIAKRGYSFLLGGDYLAHRVSIIFRLQT